MAEYIEVIKALERMCKHFDGWEDKGQCSIKCPLLHPEDNRNPTVGCGRYMLRKNPENAERIIMEWARENPIKTNADKFKEVFGYEPDKEHDPCTKLCLTEHCEDCECHNFWHKEYKGCD